MEVPLRFQACTWPSPRLEAILRKTAWTTSTASRRGSYHCLWCALKAVVPSVLVDYPRPASPIDDAALFSRLPTWSGRATSSICFPAPGVHAGDSTALAFTGHTPCEADIFCECMHRRCYLLQKARAHSGFVVMHILMFSAACVTTAVGMCAWRYLAFQPIPGAAAWVISTPDSHFFLSCVIRA